MPEGPEVQCVVDTLFPKITERTLTDVQVNDAACVQKQKYVSLEDFMMRVPNTQIQSVERKGKFIVIHAINNQQPCYLIIHLAMTGKVFVVHLLTDLDKKDQKHAHVVFDLDNGQKLVYCDHRKFGGVRLFTPDEYHDKKINDGIVTLGPEYTDIHAEELFLQNAEKCKSKTKKGKPWTIKEVILDQKVIAGIGNIYAAEILFSAGIRPQRPITHVTQEELKDIFKYTCEILDFAISVGGSSISDYVDSEGNRGSMQLYHKVYEREHCSVCGMEIANIQIDGRSSYYCPSCQI